MGKATLLLELFASRFYDNSAGPDAYSAIAATNTAVSLTISGAITRDVSVRFGIQETGSAGSGGVTYILQTSLNSGAWVTAYSGAAYSWVAPADGSYTTSTAPTTSSFGGTGTFSSGFHKNDPSEQGAITARGNTEISWVGRIQDTGSEALDGDTWDFRTLYNVSVMGVTAVSLPRIIIKLAAGSTTYTRTVDLDAKIQKTYTRTVGLDAVLQRQGTLRTADLDATLTRVATTYTRTADLDAILQGSQSRTAGLDAVLQRQDNLRTADLDAALARTQTRTADLDAVLQKTFAATTDIDAALQKTATRTVDLDATLILSTVTYTRTADLDAALQRNWTRTADLDAVLQKAGSVTVGLDAVLWKEIYIYPAVDGSIRSTNTTLATAYAGSNLTIFGQTTSEACATQLSAGYTVEAYYVSFDTGSVLGTGTVVEEVDFSIWTLTETGNSGLELKSIDWGATLETSDWQTPTQLTAATEVATRADGAAASAYQTLVSNGNFVGEIVVDGLSSFVLAEFGHVDSVSPGSTNYLTFEGSAYTSGDTHSPRLRVVVSSLGTPSTTYTRTADLDAVVQGGQSRTTSLDAVIQKAWAATTDLDAVISRTSTATADLDAILLETWTVTADLDAVLQKTFSASTDLDAALQHAFLATAGLDAVLQRAASRATSLDAILQGSQTRTVDLDAQLVKAGSVQVTASVDAVLQRQGNTVSADLDAVLSRSTQITASLSAALKKAFTAASTLDAILQKGWTASADLDALVIRTTTATVDLDAAISKVVTATADLDAILQKAQTRSVSLDATLVPGTNTVTVGLDAILGRVYQIDVSYDWHSGASDGSLSDMWAKSAGVGYAEQGGTHSNRETGSGIDWNPGSTSYVDQGHLRFDTSPVSSLYKISSVILDAYAYTDSLYGASTSGENASSVYIYDWGASELGSEDFQSVGALATLPKVAHTENISSWGPFEFSSTSIFADHINTEGNTFLLIAPDIYRDQVSAHGQLFMSSTTVNDTASGRSIPRLTITIDGSWPLFRQVGLDAILASAAPITVGLDAVLQRQQTATTSLDAVTRKVFFTSSSVDAVIQGGQTRTTSLDAVLTNIQVGNRNGFLDAILLKAWTVSVDLDGIAARRTQASADLDAVVARNTLLTVDLDAKLIGTPDISVGLDAVLQGQQTASVDLDAYLGGQYLLTVDLDAYLGKTYTGSFVQLDAVLAKRTQATADLDAYLVAAGRAVTSLDAVLQRADNLLAVDLDALLSGQTALTASLDAVVYGRVLVTALLDGVILGAQNARTVRLDAYLWGQWGAEDDGSITWAPSTDQSSSWSAATDQTATWTGATDGTGGTWTSETDGAAISWTPEIDWPKT